MASPRNDSTKDLMSLANLDTPSLENAAGLDAPNEDIEELETLVNLLAELTETAGKCYRDRLEYDMGSINFKRRDEERERKMNKSEDQLDTVREQAADLKDRRDSLRSQLSPHSSTYLNSTVEPWIKELDKALLNIEQQKLIGILSIIDLTDIEFTRAQFNLNSVQDSRVRAEIGAALDKVHKALWDLRDVYDEVGNERHRAINRDLIQMGIWDPQEDDFSLGSVESGEMSDSSMAVEASDNTSSSISDPSLNPSLLPQMSELELTAANQYMHDHPFQFDSNNPPSLLRLASWLGLKSATEAALLLQEGPIQNAFATYRARAEKGQNENLGRLKLCLPLFTFSRETLCKWQSHMDQSDNCADCGVALFANQVVHFLEGSCDFVDWVPVSSNMDGLILSMEDYEIARYRWATVLQIFWFLEKSFA
ncbi:hypothetical protein GQX73_g8348 [Xylaria multiplex]|uniref:Uncharacterized protein n=1 Tax=Xylaria multiplex TaxID=323545 RepID=A0A7C8IMH4_9PEZI|nr:hypothetical protein GQX73_g8348 [Xylaria multiplex]